MVLRCCEPFLCQDMLILGPSKPLAYGGRVIGLILAGPDSSLCTFVRKVGGFGIQLSVAFFIGICALIGYNAEVFMLGFFGVFRPVA